MDAAWQTTVQGACYHVESSRLKSADTQIWYDASAKQAKRQIKQRAARAILPPFLFPFNVKVSQGYLEDSLQTIGFHPAHADNNLIFLHLSGKMQQGAADHQSQHE